MKKVLIQNEPEFNIYKSGNNPRLLIHSGTHGDEYEIIDLVNKALKKYETSLPAFIIVPHVSPSAVEKRSRTNYQGSDINRVFFSNSDDKEVRINILVLEGNKFDLFVSFHEDPESSQYYIYDSGYSPEQNKLIINHNQILKVLG